LIINFVRSPKLVTHLLRKWFRPLTNVKYSTIARVWNEEIEAFFEIAEVFVDHIPRSRKLM
jgi:hypothetical protein